MVSTIHKAWTDQELLALPDDARYELVDGELIRMSPAGGRHGYPAATSGVPTSLS